MRYKKLILRTIITCIIIAACCTWLCNKIIVDNAAKRLYTDVAAVPYNKVGLLLGTSRMGRTGQPNPYYWYRLQAATALIRAGKIKYLVISGDNSRKDYNEPEDMRQDLMKAGIDSSIIYLDYAGFRTFDSMVRLKEIFGQDAATIISQQFHNERAIYLADKTGINAVGFNATTVGSVIGLRIQMREKLARVKLFVDYLLHKKPRFLGDRIHIPA